MKFTEEVRPWARDPFKKREVQNVEKKIPVIIDCDTGVDDAGALMMACASDRLDILAVTTVSGNVGLEHTHPNTLRVLKLFGREDIPVAKGADRPLVRPPFRASLVHGFDGIQGYRFPEGPSGGEVSLPAAAFLAKVLEEQKEPVTVVALGPMTNIAILLLSRPDLKEKIRRIVFMGVSYQDGNPSPLGTFNIIVDPEAFRICLESGVDFYACPLDTLRSAVVTREQAEQIRGMKSQAADFIYRTEFAPRTLSDQDLARINASGNEEAASREDLDRFNETDRFALLDQGTMAFVIAPELFTWKKYYCRVECQGSFMNGFTYVDKRNYYRKTEEEKNLWFVETVSTEGFAQLYLNLLERYEDR